MKKVISIVVVLGMGEILFWFSSSNISPATDTVAVKDTNSPISSAPAPELQPAQTIDNKQPVTEAPPPPQSTQPDFQLQPHEIAIVQEWADERGYDVDGRFTLSYESINEEALNALAKQDDPKAHFVLANRILAYRSGYQASREDLDKAEHHLYAASVLGYTSTLSLLSDLMYRKSIHDFKARPELILEAYKYAYVGELRGDINSRTMLELLKKGSPISASDNESVLKRANNTYAELSQERESLGLPEFDNTNPPEVEVIVKMAKDSVAVE